MFQNGHARPAWLFVLALGVAPAPLFAQASSPAISLVQQSGPDSSSPTDGTPLTITLQDALERARANDPQYHSAVTDLGVAREERVQARAGLLPNISINNSFIYTEATGQPPACALSSTCPSSRFIANHAPHEYVNHPNPHDALPLTNFAD